MRGAGPELLLKIAEVVVNLTFLVLPASSLRLAPLVLVVNLLVTAAPPLALLLGLALLRRAALVALLAPRPVDVEAVGARPVVGAEDPVGLVVFTDAPAARASRPRGAAPVALAPIGEVNVTARRVRARPVPVAHLLRRRWLPPGGNVASCAAAASCAPARPGFTASVAPAAKGKVDVAARGIGTRPIAVAPLLGSAGGAGGISPGAVVVVVVRSGGRVRVRGVVGGVVGVGVAPEGICEVTRREVEALPAPLTLREGHRQRAAHELRAVEPVHRRLRGVRVHVGHRRVALWQARVAIAVEPDLLASPLLVLLELPDGAEVRGDVPLGDGIG